MLLGAVPAVADALGSAGLVFIDGHEDATPMERSTSGEAANMEVAFLLGLTGHEAPQPLRRAVGVLQPDAIVMLGMRAAGDPAMSGGLSWSELGAVAASALRVGGACGWSFGVYNTDLDPERRAAEQIVNFVTDVTSSWI